MDLRRRLPPLLVLLCVAAGLCWSLWHGLSHHGLYYPDEIYQTLEPAHRLAFGYGFIGWEFEYGARSWTLPASIAALLRVASTVGLDDPSGYLGFVRVTFALLALLGAAGVYPLARAHRADRLDAALVCAALCLSAPLLYFAPRTLSSVASLPALVWGLALALPADSSRRARVGGTALVALAVLLRLQNAIFAIGLLVTWMTRAEREGGERAIRDVGVALGVGALAYGLVDWATWGTPFGSAATYILYNLQFEAEGFEVTYPVHYYLTYLWEATGPLVAAIALLAAAGARRAPALCAMFVAAVALHTVVPNKQLRFVLPALPLLFAAAGPGLTALRERLGAHERISPRALHGALGATLAALALASAATLPTLTYGELGQSEHLGVTPDTDAFAFRDELNRALLAAHQREDLCGLHIAPTGIIYSGGYTYLHRDVPVYGAFSPPGEPGSVNYVVVQSAGRPAASETEEAWRAREAETVETFGVLELRRLATSTCERDPAFEQKLPYPQAAETEPKNTEAAQ